MKRCPYCGTEFSDELETCPLDNSVLIRGVAKATTSAMEPGLETAEGVDGRDETSQPKSEPADSRERYPVFPEYQWTAGDAWKCIGVLIVLEFVAAIIYLGLEWRIPGLYYWRISGWGRICTTLQHYGVALITIAYFGRTESLKNFWLGLGLDKKPTGYVWFGIAMALVVRLFGSYMRKLGWGSGVIVHDLIAFRHTPGAERYLFLVPLVFFAPLFEEPVYRGFLYKAFRGSYGITTSLVLVAAWTAFTHWPYYSHSLLAAFDLSVLSVVQCWLREKSCSLWDCILCHFAFNASMLFLGGVFR